MKHEAKALLDDGDETQRKSEVKHERDKRLAKGHDTHMKRGRDNNTMYETMTRTSPKHEGDVPLDEKLDS